MTWVLLDDNANEHEKLVEAGGEAAWLWACGLMYCNRQKKRTGFIPSKQVRTLYAGYSAAQAIALSKDLVRVGSWEPVDGGFLVHDYHVYQKRRPSGDGEGGTDPELSLKRSLAGQKGGLSSAAARATSKHLLQANGEANFASSNQASCINQDEFALARAGGRASTPGDGSGLGSGSEGLREREQEAAALSSQEPVEEYGLDLAKRVWSELWSAKYGEPFELSWAGGGKNGDEQRLMRLGRMAKEKYGAQAEQELRRRAANYLADTRAFCLPDKHPLCFLESKWNVYGDAVAPGPVKGKDPRAQPPAPRQFKPKEEIS